MYKLTIIQKFIEKMSTTGSEFEREERVTFTTKDIDSVCRLLTEIEVLFKSKNTSYVLERIEQHVDR